MLDFIPFLFLFLIRSRNTQHLGRLLVFYLFLPNDTDEDVLDVQLVPQERSVKKRFGKELLMVPSLEPQFLPHLTPKEPRNIAGKIPQFNPELSCWSFACSLNVSVGFLSVPQVPFTS